MSYGLRAAAIAVYPMYKGLARLVGMETVGKPKSLDEEIDVLGQAWNDYDFFFVHFKYTDSRGEDGNFPEKVKMIEKFDSIVPRIEALKEQEEWIRRLQASVAEPSVFPSTIELRGAGDTNIERRKPSRRSSIRDIVENTAENITVRIRAPGKKNRRSPILDPIPSQKINGEPTKPSTRPFSRQKRISSLCQRVITGSQKVFEKNIAFLPL